MEQIEAGKRKISKERRKRDASKHREQSSENQKNLPRQKAKQAYSSIHRNDNHNKNKKDNRSPNDSATTSELTSPISENVPYRSSSSSRKSSTRKEKSRRYRHVSDPNYIEDGVNDMLPTSSWQPLTHKSNIYVDNSWDCADQGERKTGIQHNQLKVYEEINYSGNCASIKDNLLVNDDGIEEGEHMESVDNDQMQGKFYTYSLQTKARRHFLIISSW